MPEIGPQDAAAGQREARQVVSEDNSDLSLAIRECMQLFLQNFTANPVETTLRIRALQDLSQDMDTDLLMLLAKATSRAKAAGELEDGLRSVLTTQGAARRPDL